MKRSLIICISTGVLFLAALLGYLSWYHQVVALSASVDSLTAQITTRSRAEERIATARTEISGLSDEEAEVGGYFVAQANIVPFIEELQSLGSTAGAAVSILSVAAATSGANPPITITLTISGTFDHVVRAVGAIEYAPYDLTVSALALAGQAGTWQANMTVVVGATAGSAPVAGAAAALPALPLFTASSTARAGATTTPSATPSL